MRGGKTAVPLRGVLAFLALTCASTWLPAWLLRGTWLAEGRPLGTQLLTCSLFYAISMGWQPLAAVWIVRRWIEPPDYLDHGLKPAPAGFVLLAGVAPIAFAAAAMLLAWSSGLVGAEAGQAHEASDLLLPSWRGALALSGAFVGTLVLIWVQSLSEEIAWRGFLLTRLMQRLGPWRGLCLHAVVWGAWYAPIFVLASDDVTRAAPRGAAFLLTCSLLGVLLGWLRLASKSIVPTTVANAVLTLGAGLPFLLQDIDVGLRDAAYGPPGWPLLAAAIVGLGASRWKHAVATPSSRSPLRRLPDWRFVAHARLREPKPGPRVLH